MKCLDNLSRISYQPELVMELIELYHNKGKDFYYENIFKNEMNSIIKSTVEKDTFYAAKYLDLSITQARMKAIIKRDSQPKTKDEQILSNLKGVFNTIQADPEKIELTSNEFIKMAYQVFKGVKSVDYKTFEVSEKQGILYDKKRVSIRNEVDKELSLYRRCLNEHELEITQLITNFYIDIVNNNIYTSDNEFLDLLILYCLLFRERFFIFKYCSFFEIIFENKNEFYQAVSAANYNYSEGFSKTMPLNELIIKYLISAYETLKGKAQSHTDDKKLTKLENIASLIMTLPDTFTKEDIKKKYPTISDSTIQRALKQLKDQGKIRPNGTGRSATWNKIVENEFFNSKVRQMSLFELTLGSDDLKEE